MNSKELLSVFSKYDVPVISGMPLHRRLKAEEYNFKAWPVDLEPFPAYLAATVELTMQLATLKDARHCLQTPTASRKRAARPAAEVLRTEETITSSHKEEIKNFIQKRDKKIRISKQPVTNAAVVNDILQTLVEETSSSSLPPANTTVGSPCRDKEIDLRSRIAYSAMQIYFRELKLDWASRLVWKTLPSHMHCRHTHTRTGPIPDGTSITQKALPNYYDTATYTRKTDPYFSRNTRTRCMV